MTRLIQGVCWQSKGECLQSSGMEHHRPGRRPVLSIGTMDRDIDIRAASRDVEGAIFPAVHTDYTFGQTGRRSAPSSSPANTVFSPGNDVRMFARRK